MIIADAGYGFLFLLLALFLKWKFPGLKAMGKRFIKLMLILSTSVIIWGTLTTSYFGLEILPENPLSKISFLSYLAEKKTDYHVANHDDVYQKWVKEFPQLASVSSGREMLDGAVVKEGKHQNHVMLNDFRGSILLELSLLIGIIHISLSLLRYAGRNWASLGWLLFIGGGYLYFPHMLQATSLVNFMGWIDKTLATQIGLELMYVGIALAIVLALVQKRMKGVTEVMHIVTVFADVLSYLRLYALALAATIPAPPDGWAGVPRPASRSSAPWTACLFMRYA
jgi:V/A-type H+-transporting ATPase subunit I